MNIDIVTRPKPAPETAWATADFTHAVVLADTLIPSPAPPWRVLAVCSGLERAQKFRHNDPNRFPDELRILDLDTGELCEEDAA